MIKNRFHKWPNVKRKFSKILNIPTTHFYFGEKPPLRSKIVFGVARGKKKKGPFNGDHLRSSPGRGIFEKMGHDWKRFGCDHDWKFNFHAVPPSGSANRDDRNVNTVAGRMDPERRRRGTVWIILLPRRTRLWTWDPTWDPCTTDIVHFELIRFVLINNASKRFVQNFYSSNIYPRDGWIFLQWTTIEGYFRLSRVFVEKYLWNTRTVLNFTALNSFGNFLLICCNISLS